VQLLEGKKSVRRTTTVILASGFADPCFFPAAP
jgi:hypothetical protein